MAKNISYDIKDIKLAETGKLKIDWAGQQMPVLQTIQTRFEKDKPLNGDPTIPLLASGNANNYPTGLKKSNDTVAHVCNVPMIVMRAINMAGAMGGQIVMAIRKAIKAVLAALNINPSGNGFVSYLKKIANYIKDMTKFIKDVTKFINGLVIYVNMIKQLIQYILSLPAKLIAFFKDCLQQAYAELRKGYLDAVASVAGGTTGDSSESAISAASDVMKQTSDLIKSSGALVTTTATVATSLTNLNTTVQYRWTGESWVKSYEGLYQAGEWSLVL